MTWFKVDDGLHDHRKTRQVGLAALGLWTLAGSWCADNLTDGFVPASLLPRWTRKWKPLAHQLVDAGMWDEDSEAGEVGYRFHDWKAYQPTRSEVEQIRAKRAASGQAGGLASARARAAASAQANPEQTSKQNSNDLRTPSRPVPSRTGLSSQSPHPSNARPNTGPDLDKIAAELHQPLPWAGRVARDVLARAGPTTDPTAYILAAIRGEPARYQPTQGPPPIGRLCDHGRDRLSCIDCAKDTP